MTIDERARDRALAELGSYDPILRTLESTERTRRTKKTTDDSLLETYLTQKNIVGYNRREAEQMWLLCKTLTNNKPLKDAERDDGRKLAKHLADQGLQSATIGKKLAWLTAMVNLAIEDRKLGFNPFKGVVAKNKNDDGKVVRKPLNDSDIKSIKKNLSELPDAYQLLVRMLAGTGMRLSEAFEIDSAEKENGIRFVTVGKKTAQSLRRVPLPAAGLSYLPKCITGPLFPTDQKDPSDAASKRLNRFLDRCGIDDPAKVIHSFRHRAQDRLRAAGCPEDVRWAILGHEEETVAAGYGEGFPVTLLKKWIEKIGF